MMELPEEVKLVESHITWLNDIIFCERQSPGTYNLHWLEGNGKSLTDDEELEENGGDHLELAFNEHNPNYASWIAIHFNNCVKCVHRDDFEGALKQLEKVRGGLGNLTGEHERLLGVTEYFLEALDWSVSRVQERLEGNEDKEGSGEDKGNALMKKWQGFQGDNRAQAMIIYLKGHFRRMFEGGYSHGVVSDLRKVLELDPDYHVWYQCAYQAIRRGRAIKCRKNLRVPSEEEVALCEKAYKLAPNIFINAFNLALMLKDYLINIEHPRHKCAVLDTNKFERCVQSFDDAILIAKDNDLKEWLSRTVMHKGILMAQFGGDVDKCQDGLNMLLELIKTNPADAVVHKMLGKIYTFGVPLLDGRTLLRDPRKARNHLKFAFEIRPQDFPSLNIYVKAFRNYPDPLPVEELLELLSLASASSAGHKQLAQVGIWKGCVLWIYNPDGEKNGENKTAACELWLSALESYPGEMDNLFSALKNPPFSIYVNGKRVDAEILVDELTLELEKIRRGATVTTERLNAVDNILKEFGAQRLDSESWRRSGFRGGSQRRSSGRRLSSADQDDNWRV